MVVRGSGEIICNVGLKPRGGLHLNGFNAAGAGRGLILTGATVAVATRLSNPKGVGRDHPKECRAPFGVVSPPHLSG